MTQQKEIARLEESIRRFEDWARRTENQRHIKQARNKQRQIDGMDKVDRPVLERRRMALRLRGATRGGERVVELRDVEFDPVLTGVELTVMRGERIGVIGANGAGKTVLLRLLCDELAPTERRALGGARHHVRPPHADRRPSSRRTRPRWRSCAPRSRCLRTTRCAT